MRKLLAFYALLTVSLIPLSSAFIAYECGGSETNYTAISIAEVERCDIEDLSPIEENVVIQLLQPRSRTDVMAMSCKVEINYIVFHCGMHSHASIAHGGIVSRVMEVSRDQCNTMHRERTIQLYGHRMSGLVMNGTIRTELDFAGWIGYDQSCSAGYFVDGNKNWGSVVATGSITISLQEHLGSIDMDSGKIHFRTGSVCLLSDSRCMDNDYGPTFWTEYTKEDCRKDAFHVLYRGSARKLTSSRPNHHGRSLITYTVQSDQTVFTLTSDGSKHYCFLELKTTDHPKLLIHEVQGENWYFTQEEIPTLDMDMFMYVNTKFMHLEKVIANNMIAMHREIVTRRCELERQMLETRLSLAAVSPLEFAYEHMGRSDNLYENEINDTMQLIVQWMNNNNLKINLEKTNLMWFSQRLTPPNFKIAYQDTILSTVKTTKFLGIIIDKNLNWKAHTEALIKRISSIAYALFKLAAIVNFDAHTMAL